MRTLPDRFAVLFLNIDCLPLVASAGASGYWMFFGAALQPGHRHLVDPHQMTPNQRLKCEFFNFWRSLAYLADHLLARKIFSTRDLIERESLIALLDMTRPRNYIRDA